jgi:hypothetical protein
MGSPESIQYVNAGDALGLVNKHAREMADVDAKQERGYAHLGRLLLEVSDLQLWRVQYDTFKDYLQIVSKISKRSVGQLQQYLITFRDLSDVLTMDQLEQIGITKATQLRKAKDYAIVFPARIVDAALDFHVTASELKKLISTTLKLPEDDGDWMDLDFAFYVSPEERETIESALRVAARIDPPIKNSISTSAQNKEAMLRLCMDMLSTYGNLGDAA